MNHKKVFKTIIISSLILFLPIFLLVACSSEKKDIGIGPIKEVKLEPINPELVTKGKGIYEMKCLPCHKMDERLVGPPMRGVTKRRTPEWIMNMILNPQEMTQQDPVAKELLGIYLIQMTFQDVSQDDARALLEYFRSEDK